MPPLNDVLKAGKRVLIVGDYGAGKTSLLGQAAREYEIFTLDADGLNRPLAAYVPPEYHDKFHIEPIQDKVLLDERSGRLKPIGEPKAWSNMMSLLRTSWIDSVTGKNYGNVQSWGTDRIIVVDSFTHLAIPCWNFCLYLSSTDFADRFVLRKRQVDWGDAIDRQMALLHALTKGGLNCHVIVNTHLKHLTVEDAVTHEEANALMLDRAEQRVKEHGKKEKAAGNDTGATGAAAIAVAKRKQSEERKLRQAMAAEKTEARSTMSTFKRYPVALGQVLPENFGSYFDFVVQAKRGKDGVPYLQTTPDPDVDLKCPMPPSQIRRKLDYETAVTTLLSL